MNKKQITSLSAIVAVVFVFSSCAVPPGPPIQDTGFVAFDTPRTFDAPGEVYRIESGKVYHVGSLSNVVARVGTEQTFNTSALVKGSFAEELKTVGVDATKLPASAQASLGITDTLTLTTVSGTREFLDDIDITDSKLDALFEAAGYKEGNQYYIIRETVSCSNIDFKSERKFDDGASLAVQVNNVLSSSGSLSYSSDRTISLQMKFDKPMRVWYLAEKIQKTSKSQGPGMHLLSESTAAELGARKYQLRTIPKDELRIP